jgi:hypothetical protein
VTHPWKRDQAMSQQSIRSLHLICRSRRSSAASENPIGADDLRHELALEPNGSLPGASHRGRLGSWLSLGLEFVEGLGGLGKGVGDGLVPVHVGAAGAEFSRALPAQSFRHDQAERSENR